MLDAAKHVFSSSFNGNSPEEDFHVHRSAFEQNTHTRITYLTIHTPTPT